jgi:hypothetical protein
MVVRAVSMLWFSAPKNLGTALRCPLSRSDLGVAFILTDMFVVISDTISPYIKVVFSRYDF